jgi:hypothetical protein
MDKKQQIQIMAATVKSIKDLLQRRLSIKIEALNALQTQPLENVPDVIQKMREEEAAKIRAVLQEQKDLIEIINTMFPDA